jgi:hypothetical protein
MIQFSLLAYQPGVVAALRDSAPISGHITMASDMTPAARPPLRRRRSYTKAGTHRPSLSATY